MFKDFLFYSKCSRPVSAPPSGDFSTFDAYCRKNGKQGSPASFCGIDQRVLVDSHPATQQLSLLTFNTPHFFCFFLELLFANTFFIVNKKLFTLSISNTSSSIEHSVTSGFKSILARVYKKEKTNYLLRK